MVARVTVITSYITAFMALYVTFLDVTGGYHKELKPIWAVYYVLVSLGCWVIVPFQQAYHDNGGFTFFDKAKHSLKDEGIYYGVVFAIAGAILLYIMVTTELTMEDVKALGLALANTFGLILLTLFFGSGLVNLPLSIWNRANRESGLHFCLYKLGKLNEKMQIEQDKLQQTNAYIEQVTKQCPANFVDLLEIIRSKLPPPTSYEFAFIGSSNGTEAHGELESLQKKNIADLKRKNFISLHYIVINHRRSLAMFQTEWKDTIDRYLYLNQLSNIMAQYPRMRDLPSDSFIAPGETSYSNFPGSFMWTLPCCCGEKDNDNTNVSLFAKDIVNNAPDGSNLNDLTTSISSVGQQPIDVVQRTSSMLNANYENNTASTMDVNNDIFDDMTSRHATATPVQDSSNLMNNNSNNINTNTNVLNKYKIDTARFGNWLFRKPPVLTPGTMYYRLTWLWYKFVVYLQPWCLRIIALICFLISGIMLWSEIAIVISHKLSPLYYLTHSDVGPTTLMIFRVLPLCYIVGCIYYTIFNINLGWWFHMQPSHRTSEHSMLFSCSFMLRTIFTTTFNYYQMCSIKDTAFSVFVGPMSIIPLLGKSFISIMPLFVALFSLLTLVNCWVWFLKLLGVPHFSFSMRSKESKLFLNDGRLLIDRYQRRLTGERVEHFRSKDVDSKKLKAERDEKRSQLNGGIPKPPRESQAIKAIKEREEREKRERELELEKYGYTEQGNNNNNNNNNNSSNGGNYGSYGGYGNNNNNNNNNNNDNTSTNKNNWNSKPMPNKYNKYHSQNQPKQNLNDW